MATSCGCSTRCSHCYSSISICFALLLQLLHSVACFVSTVVTAFGASHFVSGTVERCILVISMFLDCFLYLSGKYLVVMRKWCRWSTYNVMMIVFQDKLYEEQNGFKRAHLFSPCPDWGVCAGVHKGDTQLFFSFYHSHMSSLLFCNYPFHLHWSPLHVNSYYIISTFTLSSIF
jgi:hypothetical protein